MPESVMNKVQRHFSTSLSLEQAINIKYYFALMGITKFMSQEAQKASINRNLQPKVQRLRNIPLYMNSKSHKISTPIKGSIMCTFSCQKLSILTTFSNFHLLTRLLESQVSVSLLLSQRSIATCRDTGAGVIGNYSWLWSRIFSWSMT